ncbi:hypothetical protein [Rubrivirga sp.]|uniref:hypothetical protein n=1 Tax=Rubrivirga sp. TaxID=1885344 RepID=UPI003B517CF7
MRTLFLLAALALAACGGSEAPPTDVQSPDGLVESPAAAPPVPGADDVPECPDDDQVGSGVCPQTGVAYALCGAGADTYAQFPDGQTVECDGPGCVDQQQAIESACAAP